MEERFEIIRCKHCGGKGYIYHTDDDMRRPFFIKCQCGNTSNRYLHIETAVINWNEKNKPLSAKPKYRCGNCNAEIHLGFETCPKCGTKVDW